jgi:hypothetical protein
VLALRAAAAVRGVDRVVVYEPPFVVTPDDGFGPPADFADRIDALLSAGRRNEAVKLFMVEALGMPKPLLTIMRLVPGVWKKLTAMAHTLRYDIAVMGDTQQGTPLTATPWNAVAAPTLVLTGGKSPAGFHNAARALIDVVPTAQHRILNGLNHGAVAMAPKKIAPALIGFLKG